MRDLRTTYFCRKHRACPEGCGFARKYARMSECYDALLTGAAGEYSVDWAAWILSIITAYGDQRWLRLLLWLSEDVSPMLTEKDNAATKALRDHLEKRITEGEWHAVLKSYYSADDESVWAGGMELNDATTLRGAWWNLRKYQVRNLAAKAADLGMAMSMDDVLKQAEKETLGYLKEIGNPFEKEME